MLEKGRNSRTEFSSRMNQILTTILLFSCIVSAEKSRFQKVSEHTHFEKIGKVKITSDRADLVIDIDLRAVKKSIRATCSLGNAVVGHTNATVGGHVRRSTDQLCKEDLRRWEIIEDIATGMKATTTDETNRPTRFVVTAILSALAGGVINEIWGETEDHSHIKKLAAEQGKIINILDKVDARGGVNAAHIRELQLTLSASRELSYLRYRGVAGGLTVSGAFAIQDRYLQRIGGALSMAFVSRRLSPGLFKPGAAQRHLEDIDAQARKQGLSAGFRSELDLFQTEISFGTFQSHVVRLVAHVPLTADRDRFDLFRRIPMPFALTNSSVFGRVPNPDGQLVAVSEDRTRFWYPTRADMAGWSQGMDSTFISPAVPVLSGEQQQCEGALLMGEPRDVEDLCHIESAPRTAAVWPTAAGNAVVWTPEPEIFKIKCDREVVESDTRQGMFEVELDEGCHLIGGTVEYSHPKARIRDSFRVRTPRVSITLSRLNHFIHTNSTDTELEQLIASRPRKPVPLHTPGMADLRREVDEPETGFSGLQSLIPGRWKEATVAVILLVTLGLGLLGIWRISRKNVQQQQQPGGVQDCLELQELKNLHRQVLDHQRRDGELQTLMDQMSAFRAELGRLRMRTAPSPATKAIGTTSPTWTNSPMGTRPRAQMLQDRERFPSKRMDRALPDLPVEARQEPTPCQDSSRTSSHRAAAASLNYSSRTRRHSSSSSNSSTPMKKNDVSAYFTMAGA